MQKYNYSTLSSVLSKVQYLEYSSVAPQCCSGHIARMPNAFTMGEKFCNIRWAGVLTTKTVFGELGPWIFVSKETEKIQQFKLQTLLIWH